MRRIGQCLGMLAFLVALGVIVVLSTGVYSIGTYVQAALLVIRAMDSTGNSLPDVPDVIRAYDADTGRLVAAAHKELGVFYLPVVVRTETRTSSFGHARRIAVHSSIIVYCEVNGAAYCCDGGVLVNRAMQQKAHGPIVIPILWPALLAEMSPCMHGDSDRIGR